MNMLAHTLAAMTAWTMISTPSLAEFQLTEQGIAGVIGKNYAMGNGDPEWSWSSQYELGQISATAGSDPSGTVTNGLDWLEDGSGFQLTSGVQHEEIIDLYTMFEGRVETQVEFVLDESMQMDFTYDLDLGTSLHLVHGEIQIMTPESTTWHVLDMDAPVGSDMYIFGPGEHKIWLHYTVTTYLGPRSAGEMSMDMTMWFTPLPAPGALALLGLAGCASRRRRRA